MFPSSSKRYLTLCAAITLGCLIFLLCPVAFAKKKKKKKKRRKASETIQVPIQVGIGPSFYFITGPIQDDQVPHYGVSIYGKAILDKKAISKVRKKIPAKYRKLFGRGSEARIGHILVPDAFFISPKTKNTQIYGASWRPLAIDIPLLRAPRLTIGAGVLLTYAYINSDLDDEAQAANPDLHNGTTHFFRPGVGLRADLEIPITRQVLFSLGWDSGFYIPQELGGDFAAIGDIDKGVWHVGRAYGMLHYRFPYSTRL